MKSLDRVRHEVAIQAARVAHVAHHERRKAVSLEHPDSGRDDLAIGGQELGITHGGKIRGIVGVHLQVGIGRAGKHEVGLRAGAEPGDVQTVAHMPERRPVPRLADGGPPLTVGRDLLGPQIDANIAAPTQRRHHAAHRAAGKRVQHQAAARAEPAVSQLTQHRVEHAGARLAGNTGIGRDELLPCDLSAEPGFVPVFSLVHVRRLGR